MKTLDIDSVRTSFAEAVRGMQKEPVILTENNVPVAVLLPVENADVETISLSLNPRFLAIIERSRASIKEDGGLSPEEVRRRLGIAPPEEEKPSTNRRKRKADGRKKD